MTAFNVVRFRVKPGRDQEFLDAHRSINSNWPGLKKVNIIKTGDQTYCIIAEWADITDLAAARPNMIATLNSFRDTLEDLGGGLGVTDPMSGPVVLALKWRSYAPPPSAEPTAGGPSCRCRRRYPRSARPSSRYSVG